MLTLAWCACAVVLVVHLFPYLVAACGGWSIRCESKPWQEPPPREQDADYRRIVAQLAEQGCEPLGLVDESGWFFQGHYWKRFRLYVFGGGEHPFAVSVYKLLPGDRWRLAVSSCLAEKGLVWTANHEACMQVIDERFIRWGVETDDIEQLIAAHQAVLPEFLPNGQRLPRQELHALAAASEEQTRQHLRWHGPLSLIWELPQLGLFCGPLMGIAAYRFGSDHPLFPIAILGGVILRVVTNYALLRIAAAERRQPETACEAAARSTCAVG